MVEEVLPTSLVELLDLGVTGFLLIMLAFGRLLPKSWVDRLLKNKDEQIAKRDDIIAAFMAAQNPMIKLVETLNDQAEKKGHRDATDP